MDQKPAIDRFQFSPVGYLRTPFSETNEIPKGLGAQHLAEGRLEVLPEYALGLKDIGGFSHLYILWVFHRAKSAQLLCSPPSDNREHGVFATRAPVRPNPIGLTLVKLLRVEGTTLYLEGVDMLDHTPVLDIKPCLSGVSSAELNRGWLAEAESRALKNEEPIPPSETQP